jgi:hypothetical protein
MPEAVVSTASSELKVCAQTDSEYRKQKERIKT